MSEQKKPGAPADSGPPAGSQPEDDTEQQNRQRREQAQRGGGGKPETDAADEPFLKPVRER